MHGAEGRRLPGRRRRTAEKDGYTAVQLGVGAPKVKNVSQGDARPLRQGEGRAQAQAGGVPGRPRMPCWMSAPNCRRPISWPDQFVDVVGTSIGKGFAGAMKRHNFAGLRASHVSRFRTGRMVRPVRPRIRAGSSRARRWPAIWVRGGSRRQNLTVVSDRSDEGLISGPRRGPRARQTAGCW